MNLTDVNLGDKDGITNTANERGSEADGLGALELDGVGHGLKDSTRDADSAIGELLVHRFGGVEDSSGAD